MSFEIILEIKECFDAAELRLRLRRGHDRSIHLPFTRKDTALQVETAASSGIWRVLV
jgi:hypothetical protein